MIKIQRINCIPLPSLFPVIDESSLPWGERWSGRSLMVDGERRRRHSRRSDEETTRSPWRLVRQQNTKNGDGQFRAVDSEQLAKQTTTVQLYRGRQRKWNHIIYKKSQLGSLDSHNWRLYHGTLVCLYAGSLPQVDCSVAISQGAPFIE